MSDLADRAAALAGGRLAMVRRLSGGSLSEVIALTLVDGRALIAKSFAPSHGPAARAEADMLEALRAKGAPVPQVVGVADDVMVMAAVGSGDSLAGVAWDRLADALARLHASGEEAFGWPVDHAFGKVEIRNAPTRDWVLFWADRRLRCHTTHVDAALGRRLEVLANRLGDLVPSRPPSALLHGDLWGGNVLVGGDDITLIDPACYWGDREVDVAMLTLFDRPPQSFVEALGLAPGWRKRQDVYRLWPLLVHLRLFGSSYRAQVENALSRLGV